MTFSGSAALMLINNRALLSAEMSSRFMGYILINEKISSDGG